MNIFNSPGPDGDRAPQDAAWAGQADAIRELAPNGQLRAAINYGNPVLAQRDPATGEPAGVSADLARELARRLGLDLRFVTFDSAGQVAGGAQDNVWDMAFLAIDPLRAETISYTAPYVLIEGTYMVRDDSPIAAIGQVDREGITVATGVGTAYDLYLSRTLAHARIVRYPTSEASMEQFDRDGLSTVAGVRQPLERHAQTHGGFRVLDGSFTTIRQAVGCPKGRDAAAALLRQYVEFALQSGFIQEGLRRSGQHDATVAPFDPAP